MRPLATQRMFIEPQQEWPNNSEPFGLDPAQLLLLGIERALGPPIVHMRNNFQPMRVVIVGSGFSAASLGMNEDVEFGLPRALPQVPTMGAGAQSQFHQRIVHGEVLVDEEGQLYEKVGRRIRPIHQLASGAHGELLELVPTVHPNLRLLGPSATPKIVEKQQTIETTAAEVKSQPTAASRFMPLQTSEQTARECGYRKLFADPGQWRVVGWGDFKEVLAKQLAHPERLKDTYRLPCYVQVIEIERSITIEQLAASVDSENTRAKGLYFLTNEIAAKLDLLSQLPPQAVSGSQRTANTLLPHDRLFRLVTANDPTADVATAKTSAKTTSEKPPLKKQIPVQFVKDREFSISREEALYDMNAGKSFGSRLHHFISKCRVFKRHEELQKWRVLISGKNLDEQLWSIRPPKFGLTDVNIREWARQSLATAGYDADTMLLEWEIFWRRKGLT